MTTAPESPPVAAPPARKRRRGFEGAGDMLRSLGLVMIGVVALWFFGQASPSDEKTVRRVDQGEDVAALHGVLPAVPLPTAPQGWVPTVSQFSPQPTGLRLGWNTASKRYVEYATTTGPQGPFLDSTAGSQTPRGDVDVDGVTWQRYEDGDGSVSLVRTLPGGVTVLVGSTRENAPEAEVRALAASVR